MFFITPLHLQKRHTSFVHVSIFSQATAFVEYFLQAEPEYRIVLLGIVERILKKVLAFA